MIEQLCHASGYCWGKLLIFTGWWLIASALIFFSWNKVIAVLFKMKQAKYWQALLVIATLSIFCAPKYFGKGHYGKRSGKGYHHSQCQKHSASGECNRHAQKNSSECQCGKTCQCGKSAE
jgi:hypothetical protein